MRRAVLATLLALCLSSKSVMAIEAPTAPDDFLPDESSLPEGYELQAELTTRDQQGEILERLYANDDDESTLRLVAVAAHSAADALSACRLAGDRLLAADFDVQPATVDDLHGIVAERRMGLSFQRATYVASGPACLGVITLGQEDRTPVGTEAPILRVMVAHARAA